MGRANRSANLSPSERARLQTVKEWLHEFETGIPVMPEILMKKPPPPQNVIDIFSFDSHRTTKSCRLVMVFINIESGEEVVAFFNVDITRKRGEKKGTYYCPGLRGQFNVIPSHKFYKFWMKVVGEKPLRWCRVHKELKSKLKGKLFTGDLSIGHRKDGSTFTQINNLHELDTTEAQTRHIIDTKKAQLLCTTS